MKNLPNRVFNSPLIWYANFEHGNHINLIRLIKPYANGDSYAVHTTTEGNKSGKMFKDYTKALYAFDQLVLDKMNQVKLTKYASTQNAPVI